uniref:Sulfate ABC transporter permease subunit CysW n=1 Tax=Olisthodiscus luteus TaxID=83000 RepID=A0A7U0KSP7_OLILU|nr:sulfate ABC transporter permease subunit CysW [Olisthodiscus luteus]QQW50481.1 sulfate ABC transporter permease subunit CysW [Olisthodiscus luteus]
MKTKNSFIGSALVLLSISYIGIVIVFPLLNIIINGIKYFLYDENYELLTKDFLHAAKITILISLLTIPFNTLFSLIFAWKMKHSKFPGKAILLSFIDLPFSVSPIISGLMIIFLYNYNTTLGSLLRNLEIKIIFNLLGMTLATTFLTLPFILREILPLVEKVTEEQEEAAKNSGAYNLQTFYLIFIPQVQDGTYYGILLTAIRTMGEFGAVSILSGNIISKTQTLTLFIEQSYKEYQTEQALIASFTLIMFSLIAAFLKQVFLRVL